MPSLPAHAQSTRAAASPSLANVEPASVDLKQGMSLEEVEKLLGKPRPTSLKNGGAGLATLQWTYGWAAASAQSSLRVDFGAKAPEQWSVSGWEWGSY